MIKSPHISALIKRHHTGKVAISFNGKILGIGNNAIRALAKAKKNMPDIENKEFLISRIQHKYLAI